MRVQRVVTNETCNQNCPFCNARRPAENAEFIARSAVRRRIDAARAGGAREIVLSGGEPTMRSDLADVVRRAATDGARVVLETNAALIDEARACALAAAGLGLARVQLVAWGADAADAITRDPGGFDAAVRGIGALAAAGVKVEVTCPIVRRNLAAAPALPAGIVEARIPAEALVLVVPVEAPNGEECAPLDEAASTITAVADEARRVGLTVRLDPSTYVPPCIFERPERVTHLFALNRGNSTRPDYAHVDACGACLVADRCPGLPRALAAGATAARSPITEHRVRRRLTVISTVEEQIERELVGRDELRSGDAAGVPEYTVRVNFHCNQACEFCFVSTHLPPASEAAVRAAIERAGSERAFLVLSGGEPTLNPRLVEYVKLARRSGVRSVELQSNAIRLADSPLAAELAAAGVERAMVSLHGSNAEISDRVTSAPGTFVTTVRGIDALFEAGVHVRLNFVFCQANHADFPSFVRFVATRWPHARIVFSFVGSHTDVVPRTAALIPRFGDVMPYLLDGLDRARAAGIEVTGFDSMCGLPLCMVPEAERSGFAEHDVAAGAGGGEFVKGDACELCSETSRCYGVRRGYAELYGTSELRAIAGPGTGGTAAPGPNRVTAEPSGGPRRALLVNVDRDDFVYSYLFGRAVDRRCADLGVHLDRLGTRFGTGLDLAGELGRPEPKALAPGLDLRFDSEADPTLSETLRRLDAQSYDFVVANVRPPLFFDLLAAGVFDRPTLLWDRHLHVGLVEERQRRGLDAVALRSRPLHAWSLGDRFEPKLQIDLERAGVPHGICRPWPVDFELFQSGVPQRAGHLFAGGNNARDWPLLMKAVRGLTLDAHIVTGQPVPDAPSNVRIETRLPLWRFRDAMASASVFALPVLPDVMSGMTVLPMAMALGVPVVATRTHWIEQYVTHEEHALLVPPGDIVAFRVALLRLHEDAELRRALAGRARQRARALCDLDAMIGEMLGTVDATASTPL